MPAQFGIVWRSISRMLVGGHIYRALIVRPDLRFGAHYETRQQRRSRHFVLVDLDDGAIDHHAVFDLDHGAVDRVGE